MFNIFSKKINQNIFNGIVDFHNHVLPGIDDGCKNVKESLKMLNIFNYLGIKKIIPSPHIYTELYPNNKKSIKSAFEKLKSNKEFIAQKVIINSYSAEYLIDDIFLNKLKNKDQLLCPFKNHVLIEIPLHGDVLILNEALFLLQESNYVPILAHPERFVCINDTKKIEQLKLRGAMTQLNINSLNGYYGKMVETKAKKWLRSGLYDFICTDAHNTYQLESISNIKITKKERKEIEKICLFQKSYI